MPRMPKKRKLELSFFLNERGRVNIERPSFPYSHGVQSILSLPFPSLPSQKEKATGR